MDSAGVRLIALSVGECLSAHHGNLAALCLRGGTDGLPGSETTLHAAGVPEKGKAFCEKVAFPEDALFLDPDSAAYKELGLFEGWGRTFFALATPKVVPCTPHTTGCPPL